MIARKPVWKTIPENCMSEKCDDHGHAVIPGDGYDQPVFIDMDCVAGSNTCRLLGGHDTRCDYLFFGWHRSHHRQCIGVIEMKSGRPDVSKVIGQLKAGAACVEKLVCQDDRIQFRPVVVHGNKVPKAVRDRLRNQKIKLFGKGAVIRLRKREARFPMQ